MSFTLVDQVFDLEFPTGKHAAKAVLSALARHVNEKRYKECGDTTCWPSQELLADETGLSSRSVRTELRYLEARQIIVEVPRGRDGWLLRRGGRRGDHGITTTYRLCIDHVPRIYRRGPEDEQGNVEGASTYAASNVEGASTYDASNVEVNASYVEADASNVEVNASYVEASADKSGTEPGCVNLEAEAENAAAAKTAALSQEECTDEDAEDEGPTLEEIEGWKEDKAERFARNGRVDLRWRDDADMMVRVNRKRELMGKPALVYAPFRPSTAVGMGA